MIWRNTHTTRWQLQRKIERLLGDINQANTMTLAAGIAYFAALAFFPSFAATFAIATIVISPEQAAAVVENVNVYLPPDIASLVTMQLAMQNDRFGDNIIFAAIAIAIALFGASAATENMIRALNAVYGTTETRNLIKLRLLSVVTLLCTLFLVVVVMVLLVIGDYMTNWGVPHELVFLVVLIRWPLLLVIMGGSFALLYRYVPDKPRATWRQVSSGAFLATGLWLVVTSALFTFAHYSTMLSAAYAIFAGIVMLMIWLNLSAFALLIGAHLNNRQEIGYKK